MTAAHEYTTLAHVGPDAPMGKLMRRYWIPAVMSEEIREPGGAPVRVGLLGEKLVAFRDPKGNVGLIKEHCPHRGASLVYARNEVGGLRCIYHGWKMDVEGNVVEMSSEPAESPLKEKVKHKAYPVHEHGGFVWTYMGPAETMPEFEPIRDIGHIRALYPALKILVVSAYDDDVYVQGLLGAGVRAGRPSPPLPSSSAGRCWPGRPRSRRPADAGSRLPRRPRPSPLPRASRPR